MTAADTPLRIALALVALVVIVFTSGLGVTVVEPFLANMPAPADSLGWPDQSEALYFMALGLVGLALTVLFWMILEPIRDDIRQELQ